jgi:putative FmdB family regulatory protein
MTYEYLCTACGHEWEASQPITAEALKNCPKCKKAAARRQVSGGTGFVLKGGGWYADLYGSAKPKPKSGDAATSSSKDDAVSSASDTSTKSEAKPEKKAEPKAGKKAAASDA